jgi:glycine oxidase
VSAIEKVRTDVLVIGAGVVGLGVGWELRCRGLDVTVLERGEPGSGASRASGGMLGPIAEAQIEEPELVTFGLESLGMYPAFVERLEADAAAACGFRPEGTLLVAVTRDHRSELEHLEETFRSKGLTATPLTSREVLEREPYLSRRVLSGLFVKEDQRIEPRALVDCLARAFLSRGGVLETGVRVDAVSATAGRAGAVHAVRSDGREMEVECSRVVVAAGAWAWEGIDLPLPDPGLRPVKGQLLRLRGPGLLKQVVRSPDIYLIPQLDGDLLVGATMEEMGFDLTASAGGTLDLLRFGWQVLPAIYDMELSETSVGLRPAMDDHLPVISPAGIDGMYLAVGHFRKGILLAPATSRYLADWIETGTRPASLEPFGIERFADGGS